MLRLFISTASGSMGLTKTAFVTNFMTAIAHLLFEWTKFHIMPGSTVPTWRGGLLLNRSGVIRKRRSTGFRRSTGLRSRRFVLTLNSVNFGTTLAPRLDQSGVTLQVDNALILVGDCIKCQRRVLFKAVQQSSSDVGEFG